MTRLSQGFLWAVLLVSALVDIPRQLSFGALSGLAALTLVCVGLPLMLWLMDARLLRVLPPPLSPFLFFLGWGFLSMAWQAPTISSVQSLMVPLAFVVLTALTCNLSRRSPDFAERFQHVMPWVATLPVVLYALSMAIDRRLESFLLMGARTFALYALIGMAWHLARWRYGYRHGLLGGLFTMTIIGLSLSRTALAAALLFFPVAKMSLKNRLGIVPVLLAIGLLAGGLYQAVTMIEPLRARFLEGDTSLSVGGIAINATGRTGAWQAILESAMEAPLLGKGIGSSTVVLERVSPGLSHPHCDYLRLLHDVGLLGLGAWAIGYLLLLRATGRAWAQAERSGDPGAVLHLAAFLSLLGMAIGMATDNTIVYQFLMAPLGIIVGASLGQAADGRSSLAAAH